MPHSGLITLLSKYLANDTGQSKSKSLRMSLMKLEWSSNGYFAIVDRIKSAALL